MEPRRQFSKLQGLALVALAAGVVFLVWFFARRGQEPAPSASEQTAFETSRGDLRVPLQEDGSVLELAPDTRVEVVERGSRSLRFSLRSGRLTCDVSDQEPRAFVVVAGDLEVRANAARFTIRTTEAALGQRVEVSVERGDVEVKKRKGHVVRLSSGQSLREEPEPPEGLVPPPLPPPGAAQPSASTAPPPAPSASSAGDLFEQASWARRMGQAREAESAYQGLLDRFPGDTRAALAAYELGRVRMDSLKDLAGAATAFEKAVALARGAAFREDALARLTQAYTELGKNRECRRAKDAYLKSYPNGASRDAVSARCSAAP